MHIYLVRHTEFNNPEGLFPFHLPFHLSVNGRQHAQRIANWFFEKKILNLPITVSPIVRTVQTAEIIAGKTGSNVETDARLIETNCPNLQGTKKPPTNSWMVEEEDTSRESRDSILKRVLNLFEEKIKNGKDCIMVSHGDPITILYYHLTSQEFPQHLWGPENEANIISRGEIVDVEVNEGKFVSAKRIKV